MERTRFTALVTVSLAAAAVGCIGVLGNGAVAATPPPQIGVAVELVADGTSPFDPAAGAGLDTDSTNAIVRTLDQVRYHVEYQFNHVSAVPRTLVLTAGNASFVAVPGACQAGSISPLGDTLTCQPAATSTAGIAGGFDVDVLVGAVADGSVVTMTATASAAGTTATDTAPDVVATAVPRWDLSALTNGEVLSADVRDAAGGTRNGFVVSIPITVEADLAVNDGRGTEALGLADLHFSLDLSALQNNGAAQPTQPDWTLLDFTDPSLGTLEPCSPQRLAAQLRPYGTIGDPGTGADSATDSGSWTCTQAGPGQPIDVVVSGAALSTSHFPTQGPLGYPLAPRKIVLSGQVAVFVDLAYIQSILPPPAGGEFPVRWTVSGFDPVGASGGSNYGAGIEPLFDNSDQATITEYYCCGGWDSYYVNSYQEMDVDHPSYGPGIYFDARPSFLEPTHSVFIPTQTQQDHAGDGVVVPGDQFALLMGRSGNGTAVPFGSAMCAMIDPAQTVLVDSPPIIRSTVDATPGPNYGHTTGTTLVPTSGPVIAQSTSSDTGVGDPTAPYDDSVAFVVEYGTGPWTASNSTCNDADSPTGWTTDPSTTAGAAGGVYPAVTKVRVRAINPLGPHDAMRAFVSLRAVGGATTAGYLWSHATYGDWSGPTWTGTADSWNSTGYDPIAHTNVHYGDRVRLADRSLVVVKQVTDDGLPKVPGDVVDFTLTATLRGNASSFVRLVDTLPAGVSLVSSDPAPASVVGSDVTWEWGVTPGPTTYTVHYSVRVDADAPPGSTLVNSVVGSAEGLAQEGSVLTSYAAIHTATPFRQLDVWKSTPDDVVEITDPVHFTLHARNASNSTLDDVDLIDVLPWQADGRNPASAFHGAWALQPVVADPSLTIRVTNAAPSTIDDDPAAASNGAGGATIWCDPVQFGTAGCPTGWADSTAIRVGSESLAGGDEIAVDLTMLPSANAHADRYANAWTGRYAGAGFEARSDEVDVTVVASGITATVVCATTGQTIPGIGVTIEPIGATGATDGNGRFALGRVLHSGSYTVGFDVAQLSGWTIDGSTEQTVVVGVDSDAVVTLSACPPVPPETTAPTTTVLAVSPPTTVVAATTLPPVNGHLPATGADVGTTIVVAVLAAVGGLALIVLGRRRRQLS